jgi:(2Fe-2S) ferredoxin
MVSVDQVYYGPLEQPDAQRLVDDLRAGRDPIPDLALSRLRSADPRANSSDPDGGGA